MNQSEVQTAFNNNTSWNKAKESCAYVYDLKNNYLFARADGTYEALAPRPAPVVKAK